MDTLILVQSVAGVLIVLSVLRVTAHVVRWKPNQWTWTRVGFVAGLWMLVPISGGRALALLGMFPGTIGIFLTICFSILALVIFLAVWMPTSSDRAQGSIEPTKDRPP